MRGGQFSPLQANLSNLREKMATELDWAIQDDHAYEHDEILALRRRHDSSSAASGKPNKWDGSAAQRLLKEDLNQPTKANLKPSALRATNPEYARFDGKVFRAHVNQWKRSRLESPHWSKKREDKQDKKKDKKTKKEDSAKKEDECEAYLQSLHQE